MGIRIKVLPEDLVSKIAAGEVVERPSSVVKELVENALDAGATEIIVDVRGGGRSHIQVIDNGCGMTRDEALLAIERHATSKIASADDLYAIQTLGFRGEALAAIGGVSRLEIVTRTPDADQAVRVRVEGGLVKSVDSVDAPVGTSMLVRRLFYNTPARLKFIRGAAVETSHVVDLVSRLAMSHEGVGFRLVRGTETLLNVSADSTGVERIREVLGADLADHLYPFSGTRGISRVSGFLSSPNMTRSGWSGLFAFVNRRFLRDRGINRAVAEAYRGTVPKGRYPVVVLFLEVPPAEVDVNVHPGKIEVRFSHPRHVSQLIVKAIRGTLVKAPWRDRGVVPGRAVVDWDPGLETPQQIEAAETLRAQIAQESRGYVDGAPGDEPPARAPFEDEPARLDSLAALEPPSGPSQRGGGVAAGRTGRRAGRMSTAFGPDLQGGTGDTPGGRSGSQAATRDGDESGSPSGEVDRQGRSESDGDAGSGPAFPSPRDADRLGDGPAPGATGAGGGDGASGPVATVGSPGESGILPGLGQANFSRMRVIGQYANCFILCQDGDDLVIIDQHAAHERVTFERLRAAYAGEEGKRQLLLTPAIVEVPAREAHLLAGLQEDLERIGLDVEPFGGRTFAVKSVPLALQGEDPGQLLVDLAGEMSGNLARRPLQERIDAMLATMACHGSIRANRHMTHEEMEALLKLLDGTDYNYACPHGRPLVVRSSRREIEKLFLRT